MTCKPTLKNLEPHFHRSALKQDEKERLTNIVDSFFRETNPHTRTNFCDYLTSQGINAMFRENKEGRIYGLTFIDNIKSVVINGSDLGKAYSGQALMKRLRENLNVKETLSAQRVGIASLVNDGGKYQLEDLNSPHCTHDMIKEFLNVMKPEKLQGESIDSNLKSKRKKLRRLYR